MHIIVRNHRFGCDDDDEEDPQHFQTLPMLDQCSKSLQKLNRNIRQRNGIVYFDRRKRLIDALKRKGVSNGAIVLFGRKGKNMYERNSFEKSLPQKEEFMWVIGCDKVNITAVIVIETGCTILIVQKKNPDVDEVLYEDNGYTIANKLIDLAVHKVYVLPADLTDSGSINEPIFAESHGFKIDKLMLINEMEESKLRISDEEIDAMKISGKILTEVMCDITMLMRPDTYDSLLKSVFNRNFFYGACNHHAYSNMKTSGCDGFVFQYGNSKSPNNLSIKEGDLFFQRIRIQKNKQALRITRTLPMNGQFSAKQKMVYTAVLDANLEVIRAAKAGLTWMDMENISQKVLLEHFKRAGVVTGDIQKAVEAKVGEVFMPRNIVQFGFCSECGKSETRKFTASKHLSNDNFQERMVVYIENSCYFDDVLLDEALANPMKRPFLVEDGIKSLRGSDGVCIGEDHLICSDGNSGFTNFPKSAYEIELLLANSLRHPTPRIKIGKLGRLPLFISQTI